MKEYKYLGQILSFADKTSKELKVRRANGWKAFWAKKSIWRSKLKLSSKIRIFESLIIPVLTYRAQTWATTQEQARKLQTTQNAMLRSIMGIKLSDKTHLQDIYRKTKVRLVGKVAKLLKFRYAGHTMRDTKLKWNYIMSSWVPHTGKRSRGHPRIRWSDEIFKEFGTSWRTKATDRQTWKGLVDAHAQKWAVEGAGG